jgi:putative Mg2+ transporter-C (MgtC) family protein
MMLWEVAVNVGLAAALGAAVGFERQWRQRLAGLRTNSLVALGAAVFALVGMLGDDVSPTRAAAQVASGIGFLGAGVILREGLNVRGLNTAATLWCSAGVGVLCGLGYRLEGLLCGGLLLLTNVGLRPIASYVDRRPIGNDSEIEAHYKVCVRSKAPREAFVRALLLHGAQGGNLHLIRLDSRDLDERGLVEVEAELRSLGRDDEALERMVGRLSLEPSVVAANWRVEQRSGA